MLAASRPLLLALPLVALLVIIVLFFGIRDDPSAQKIAARMSDTHTVHLLGGGRPAVLILPRIYDPDQSYLLMIGLHGYDSNAWEYDQYLRLSSLVNTHQLALLLPQGLKDSNGSRFWNATPWCCDFDDSGVDDAAYISALIAEASELAAIDRIAAVGHSNGGFMAYRLACEGLPRLSAAVSLAGSSFADPQRCGGAVPVSLLQIHGDADEVVLYSGEAGGDGYPGAEDVVRRWARRAGCDVEAPAAPPPLDIDSGIDGAETEVLRWAERCEAAVAVELWTIKGGGHEPDGAEALAVQIVDWLQSAAVTPEAEQAGLRAQAAERQAQP